MSFFVLEKERGVSIYLSRRLEDKRSKNKKEDYTH